MSFGEFWGSRTKQERLHDAGAQSHMVVFSFGALFHFAFFFFVNLQ